MNDLAKASDLALKAAIATPPTVARRVRGLSDRSIAWAFITPTILLLLAINIFPLIWTIRLSFTNYRANRPNAPLLSVGIEHYVSVLNDPDVWAAMQATAHFVVWTLLPLYWFLKLGFETIGEVAHYPPYFFPPNPQPGAFFNIFGFDYHTGNGIDLPASGQANQVILGIPQSMVDFGTLNWLGVPVIVSLPLMAGRMGGPSILSVPVAGVAAR